MSIIFFSFFVIKDFNKYIFMLIARYNFHGILVNI